MNREADAKAVARRFFDELVNRKNLGLVDTLVAADVVNHDPMPGEGPGTEGVKDVLRGFFTAVPDLFVTIDFMIAEGEMVACRIQMRGTHRGVSSAEGAGTPFVMKGTETFRVHEGKISERWANMDDLGMLRQLGVINP